MSLNDIKKDRIKKLEKYSENAGPYPARVRRENKISEIIEKFAEPDFSKKKISTAGRILALRDMGKMIFIDLADESGKMQAVLKAEETVNFTLLQETVDMGDFLALEGKLFITKKGEKSILAEEAVIAAKSIRPIPKEYFGIENKETLLRKRYLDILLNKETKETFRKKNIFWKTVRDHLEKAGFLEVETPVLENVPGGAEAEPFVTYHNALGRDFYLRISLELSLKKLLVGGLESVFEIGRIFRNEGISREHLQDYTQMECYRAYWDYNDMMDFTKTLYQEIVKKLFNNLQTETGGEKIDWSGEWKKVDYYSAFEKETGINLKTATEKELIKKAQELGLDKKKENASSAESLTELKKGRLIDLIYKKTVRPKLIQPCFLVDPPVEIEPLAKKREDDSGRVERFQIMAAGTELGKGFSELNDPIDQRARFEEQMKLREQGDKEAQMLSEDFLEALEYGMPPAAGFGMSERLFAVLMNKPVRETTIFPLMKDEDRQ